MNGRRVVTITSQRLLAGPEREEQDETSPAPMSGQLQWRRFAFFEKSTPALPPIEGGAAGRPTCISAAGEAAGSSGLLAIGDDAGYITWSDLNLSPESCHRIRAFEGCTQFCILRGDKLWAVGTEVGSGVSLTTIVKCWAPSFDANNELLFSSLVLRVDTGHHHDTLAAATAFAIADDATCAAVGFAEGTVLLYRDLLTSGGIPYPAPGPMPAIISPSSAEGSSRRGVASLHFSRTPLDSSVQKLFICFEEQSLPSGERAAQGVVSCNVHSAADSCSSLLLLDERGCAEGCSSISPETQELVVGRSDGVYFYSTEDRGGAAGLEGEKILVVCLSGYILVANLDDRSQRGAINIYDLQNKFIAFHALLPAGQVATAAACVQAPTMNVVYVLLSSGVLLRLKERSTASKLELLYRKNLYPVAISLAYAAGYDPASIMDIYRMYGDHLYRKCDYDGAMAQYLHTIGHLEPSYVIRRFLDAQRINLLTLYLGRLHDADCANADHTTLLLNCYTKLKDVPRLDAFIAARGSSSKIPTTEEEKRDDQGDMGKKFHVETALRVLKGAGYNDHACLLAAQHGAHDWYLRIQLERPSPDYKGALSYIGRLDASTAELYLKKHGKALVAHLPEETTGMLMALCTDRYTPTQATAVGAPPREHVSKAEDFIHLYVDRPKWLRLFLQYMLRQGGGGSPVVSNTLLELLLREWKGGEKSEGEGGVEQAAERKQREEEIMELLLSPGAEYDADHALVLVQSLDFKPGQLCLYEKLGMSSLILEHYMIMGDTPSMLRMCNREGRKSPQLWSKVLSHLVAQAGAGGAEGDAKWDSVREVLSLIAEHLVLPPLQVTGILMNRPDLPLSVARQYLSDWLREAMDEERASSGDALELEATTRQMHKEVAALKSSSSPPGFSSDLDLPTSALLLGAQGQTWIGEGAKFREIKLSQAQRSGDHEQFYRDLEDSNDGFAQIATEFGKGVIPLPDGAKP
jgi:hypothetical protein